MSNVPTNLIPTRITGLPEYTGSSTLGYLPYVLEGRTYKVQFANIAAVGAVPSTREINTGTGLGGGGDLSANRTLYILPAGVDDSRLTLSGVTAGTYGAADTVPVLTINAQGRVTAATSAPIVLSNYVPTSRTITAGAGLTGGGALSSNLTFAVNFSSTTPEPLGAGTPGVATVAARGDHVHPAVDLSDTTETQGVLPLSRGGTNNSLSPVVGAILYSSNDRLYLTPTSGSAGQVLTSAGGTGAPYWQTITGTGTVTSVDLTAGTGISVSGGPITAAGSITVTNTAPDRIVTLTGAGGTSISGTYPSFTITSSDQYVGTVTSVSGSGGSTGLTLSGGPITTTGTLTLGGTLAVTNGGTGATSAPTARANLGAAASGANTDITSIALTSGTITAAPTAGTDIVNKTYADSISAGINFHQAVRLASTTALAAYTYNNGTSGVGATITANANGALSLDGVAAVAGNRVLIKNEVSGNAPYNGVYTVTQIGNGSTPFILTRATDYNTAGTGVNQIDQGDFFLVTAGSTQANTSWVQQTPLPITVGVTGITFTQFGAPITYSAGTGLTLAGTVFSITNTGVTANTYGSASTVPVLAINAQGQVTSASSSSIAIAASQITSGILPVGNGGTGASTLGANGVLLGNGTSAISATAVGATGQVLVGNTGAAPTWATLSSSAVTSFSAGTTGLTPSTATTGAITLGGTLAAANGGTGQSSYTVGDLIYASGTTALAKLADVATGNALISGGVGVAPSWGKIGLTTHVSGTLPVANGGTGAATFTNNALLKGAGTSAISSSVMYENGGYVGINVSGPVYLLDAQETFNGSGGLSYVNLSTGASSAGSITVEAGGSYFYHKVTRSTGIVQFRGITATTLNQDFNTQVFRSTGGTEYMRIDTSGNVGIGTSSPAQRIHAATTAAPTGTTQSFLRLTGDATYGADFGGGLIQGVGPIATISTISAGTATERMRIDGSGNVGIGATTTNGKLTIKNPSASGDQVILNVQGATNTTSIGRLSYNQTDDTMRLFNESNFAGSALLFGVNNIERMRIDYSGNVGIGTSSPTSKLTVQGSVAAAGVFNALTLYNVSDGGIGLYFDNAVSNNLASIEALVTSTGAGTDDGILAFSTAANGTNTERMRIDSSGNLGVGTSTPNYRAHIYNANNGYGLQIGSNAGGASAGNYTGILMSPSNGGGNDPYYSGAIRVQTTAASPSYQEPVMTFLVQNPSTYQLADVTEKMRITGSGNVGIGTTSPASLLHVKRGSNATERYPSGTWASQIINATDAGAENGLVVGNRWAASSSTVFEAGSIYGNGSLYWSSYYKIDGVGQHFWGYGASGTEGMRLNSSGNVGIGTSSPGAKLTVAGRVRIDNNTADDNPLLVYNTSSTGYGPYFQGGVGGRYALHVTDYAGTSLMLIQGGGNVGIGTSSPGGKLEVASTTDGDTIRVSFPSAATGSTGGGIQFRAYTNSATLVEQGRIQTICTDGSASYGGAMRFMTAGSASLAERMRITAAGNVGIGTSSPSYKLSVTGQTLIGNGVAQASPSTTDIGSTAHAIISGQGGNALYFGQYDSGSGFAQWIQSSYTNPTTAKYNLILQPLGACVGIGLSTPNATLHLQGIQGGQGRMTQSSTGGTSQTNLNIIASSSAGSADQWYSYGVSSSNYYYIQTGVGAGDSGLVINSNNRVIVGTSTTFDTTVGANFMSYGSAGSAAAFKVNGAASTQVSFYDSTQSARVGWIGTSGSATSYNTTSDRRLKQNIQPVSDVGDKIDQIEIVSHQWRNGTDTVIPYGVIAQDLYEVAPHAVTKGDDGEEVGLEWGVDYSKLVPMMIKEMQALRARVAELEGK